MEETPSYPRSRWTERQLSGHLPRYYGSEPKAASTGRSLRMLLKKSPNRHNPNLSILAQSQSIEVAGDDAFAARRFGTFQYPVVVWIVFNRIYRAGWLDSRRASVNVAFGPGQPLLGKLELIEQYAQSLLQDGIGDEKRHLAI